MFTDVSMIILKPLRSNIEGWLMPWKDKWEVFKFTKFINLVLSLKIGYRTLWCIGNLTFIFFFKKYPTVKVKMGVCF